MKKDTIIKRYLTPISSPGQVNQFLEFCKEFNVETTVLSGRTIIPNVLVAMEIMVEGRHEEINKLFVQLEKLSSYGW